MSEPAVVAEAEHDEAARVVGDVFSCADVGAGGDVFVEEANLCRRVVGVEQVRLEVRPLSDAGADGRLGDGRNAVAVAVDQLPEHGRALHEVRVDGGSSLVVDGLFERRKDAALERDLGEPLVGHHGHVEVDRLVVGDRRADPRGHGCGHDHGRVLVPQRVEIDEAAGDQPGELVRAVLAGRFRGGASMTLVI